jgi:hypothetical protein
MSRNKAFNEEEVIDKAVKEFWAKGYEATSMDKTLLMPWEYKEEVFT